MTKTTHLTIATVDETFFSGEAYSVTIPGEVGEMTILPEHASIITPLRVGMVTVRFKDGEKVFPIESGICEVSNNQVTVLL